METFLLIIQIILAVMLAGLILVQTKGTGLGRSRSGSSSFTRRGLEKVIYRLTFIISALFIIISILQFTV